MGEEPEAVAFSNDIHTLTVLLREKQAEAAALRRRVEFLETRLQQRAIRTENKFHERIRYFESVSQKVYELFLRDPTRGFTYDEFCEIWEQAFPNIPVADITRRIRECRAAGLLWSSVDPVGGKVRFYVKLENLPDERKGDYSNGQS